jgi:hypothetical protein
MSESLQKPAALPKGVEHLHDKMYRVSIDTIQLADGGFNKDSKDLEFKNLRHALVDHKILGRGLSKEDAADLRERIRTEGLLHSPLLRWYKGGVQIVCGERRIRSLLKLVHDNAKCWDRSKNEYVPAKDLYGTIDVEVQEMSDRDAYRISFSETESVKLFGDGAKIAAISYFRSCGEDDKAIIAITGYGPEWLHQAEKLGAGLSKKCFDALCNDEMNLQVANKLAEIVGEDKQEASWDQWKANSEKRFFEKLQVLEGAVKKATAAIADAEELKDSLAGEASEKAKKDLAAATKKRTKAKKAKVVAEAKVKKLAAKKPKATPKDAKSENDDPKPLTGAKMEKAWYLPVVAVIKNDGCDGEGTKLEVDVWDAKLVKMLIEQFRKGQTDILRILVSHNKKKQK